MSKRSWVVRIRGREELCRENNIIAIGWVDALGIDAPEIDWNELKAKVQAVYAYKSPRALGQAAGSIWRFAREIQAGDWIVAPVWSGFNIGVVQGGLMYEERFYKSDSAWCYPVKWIRHDVPREIASAPLQARCSSRQTCIEASEFSGEIEQLSLAKEKPGLNQALVQSEANAAIGKILDAHLTPDDLENLIMTLAGKHGASVEIPAKNYANKKGDVDVIARYRFPPMSVGYQVKKHFAHSMTDEFAVQQIIDAVEDAELDLDIGCVVTTAEKFTDTAIKLAEAGPNGGIRLLARDDLVHWILSVGIS